MMSHEKYYMKIQSGVCILAHVATGERGGPPHDHGLVGQYMDKLLGNGDDNWKCLKKPTWMSRGWWKK